MRFITTIFIAFITTIVITGCDIIDNSSDSSGESSLTGDEVIVEVTIPEGGSRLFDFVNHAAVHSVQAAVFNSNGTSAGNGGWLKQSSPGTPWRGAVDITAGNTGMITFKVTAYNSADIPLYYGTADINNPTGVITISMSSIVEVNFTGVTQTGGVSNLSATTALTLSFSIDPAGITSDNITVTGASKGALSGTGTTRSLAIYDITVANGESVSVTVTNPAGFRIYGSPKTAVVYKAPEVINISAIPGVVVPVRDEIPVTTEIDTVQYTGTITWSPSGSPFAASTVYTANIVLTAKNGFTLTGVPENFFTVAGAEAVNAVNSGNVAAVFPATGIAPDIEVTFSGVTQTGGTSGTVTTTALTLSFSADPVTLTADNITVTGATKGVLSGTGTTRSLAVSDITVANGATVSVTVTSPAGYAITGSPKTAVVYKAPTPVTFNGVTQVGGTSNTVTTTALALSFSTDPTTLTAGNITVTGATKGALSGTGTTRTLAITAITVANEATVTVAVTSPSGFTISGSPKTAVVYVRTFRVTYNAGTGNGSGSVPVDNNYYSSGSMVIVSGNTGNLVGTVITSGIKQRFLGWNTNPSATTAQYGAGNSFSITADTTLYAIYTTGTDVLRKIGPGGGWVFYDAGSNQSWGRYLEAAPSDVSTYLRWYNGVNKTTGATATAIGTGLANSETIKTSQGENYRSYAAGLARAMTYGGYTNWYLPSKDELNQMYLNLKKSGVGGLAFDSYWSSSEYSSDWAWGQSFSTGEQYYGLKEGPLYVRSVRAFN